MNLKILLFISLCCIIINARSQSVSSAIIDKYPPSVVSRVYEVLSAIQLNESRQKRLAVIFWQDDSAVVVAIKANKEKTEIDRIHRITNARLNLVFNKEELNQYYFHSLKDDAYKQAIASASSQSNFIGGDSSLTIDLTKAYFNQYLELGRIKQQFKYSPLLSSHIKHATTVCDSVTLNIIKHYKENKYISERILQLDSIKPLKDTDRKNFKNGFIHLCKIRPTKSYPENFTQIMHSIIKDTIYYSRLHRNEIKKRASINALHLAAETGNTYKLPKRCYDTLVTVLQMRERKMATIFYSFPTIGTERIFLERTTVAHYDSIINNILYHEGVKTPNSQFFIAVRYRDNIKLTKKQVDTLINVGFKFDKLVNLKKQQNDISFNAKNYEREKLRAILTEDQLYNLIRLVSKEPAKRYAMKDWKEMESFGLVSTVDSASVMDQLYKYQLSKISIADYYKDDERSKRDRINSIEASKPSAIRELQAARKMEAAAAKNANKPIEQLDNNVNGGSTLPKSNPLPKYRGSFQY